jgi:hypothetical protein
MIGGMRHCAGAAGWADRRAARPWVAQAAAAGTSGTYNATGETIAMGTVLRRCLASITGSSGTLVWVDSARLLASGVDPWMGVPLWIAAPGWEGASRVEVARAKAAGAAVSAAGRHHPRHARLRSGARRARVVGGCARSTPRRNDIG